MKRPLVWGLLLLISAVALALRWTGLDWDGYNHYHPDERYITWVATTIAWPDDWISAVTPHLSPLNPYYWPPDAADLTDGVVVPSDEPRAFAYGHLPLYLGVAATRLVEQTPSAWIDWVPLGSDLGRDLFNLDAKIEFRHLTAVARALTGLADVGTLLLLFLLGKRIYGSAVGLLAAAFLAVNVMHIQLAHFFISDPFLTLFVVAALFALVASLQAKRPGIWLLLGAAMVGLAVGSKFSAVMLMLPLTLAVGLVMREKWIRWLAISAVVAFLSFALTNPFALLDFSCDVVTPAMQLGPITIPALDWGSCYLANIVKQNGMVNGSADLGFTRQYQGTLPYFYYVEMQLRWGMGWPLGIVAFAGFVWAIVVNVRYFWRRWRSNSAEMFAPTVRTPQHAVLLLLAWCVPFFLVTGSFYVKFMRYLQPLTPFLMLFGAAMLWTLLGKIRWGWVRGVVIGAVVGLTALYALAFVQFYASDHPWDVASRWVYENIEPGTLIASEQWDDALPTTLPVNGELRRRGEYENEELTWLTGPDAYDTEAKLAQNLDLLARAEYVTVLSNRVYGVVPRLDERYPLSSQYHQLLFDGELGYEPVFVQTRTPNLLGLALLPDSFGWPGLTPPADVAAHLDATPHLNGGRFDESFTVYDQPLVMVFENVGGLDSAEMAAKFRR